MSATLARPGAQLPPARVVYPVLRTASIALGVFVVVVSLVDDPSGATGSGGLVADWISRLVFGTPEHGDKVAHLAAYAALSLLTVVAFGRHRRSAGAVLIVLLALGGALELAQAAGGVRTGDWLDMLANGLGVVVGGALGAAARLGARARGLSPA